MAEVLAKEQGGPSLHQQTVNKQIDMSQNTVLQVNSALFVYRQKHNPDPGEGFSGFSNDLCNLQTITTYTVSIY